MLMRARRVAARTATPPFATPRARSARARQRAYVYLASNAQRASRHANRHALMRQRAMTRRCRRAAR